MEKVVKHSLPALGTTALLNVFVLTLDSSARILLHVLPHVIFPPEASVPVLHSTSFKTLQTCYVSESSLDQGLGSFPCGSQAPCKSGDVV